MTRKNVSVQMTPEDAAVLQAGIAAYSARMGMVKPMKLATATREWLLAQAIREIEQSGGRVGPNGVEPAQKALAL